MCTDGYFTLLIRDQIRKNKLFKRVDSVEKIAIQTPMFYPPIPMFIGAILPDIVVKKYFGLINSAIDLLLLTTMVIVADWLNASHLGIIFMSVAFIFIPYTFDFNATSNIHFNLSWRDLGKITTCSFYLTYFICSINFIPDLLVISILSFFVIINLYTTLFAYQAILFGSLVLGVLEFDFVPIVSIALGNLLVLVFDSNWLFQYYKIRYRYGVSYYNSMRNSHPGTTGNFSFKISHLKDVISYLITFNWKKLKSILKSDPILRGIYLFPTQLPVSLLLAFDDDPISSALFSWYFTAVILWVLTSNKALKIFGEPDRYLEFFGHLPILRGICFLIPKYTMETVEFWSIIISVAILPLYIRRKLLSIIKALTYIFLSVFVKNMRFQRRYRKVIKKSDFPSLKNKIVLPISFSNAWKVAYKFDCQVIFPPMFTDTQKTNFICKYPYPNWENIQSILQEYSVDYLALHKSLKSNDLTVNLNRYSKFEQEVDDYYLYRIVKKG